MEIKRNFVVRFESWGMMAGREVDYVFPNSSQEAFDVVEEFLEQAVDEDDFADIKSDFLEQLNAFCAGNGRSHMVFEKDAECFKIEVARKG